MNRENKINLIQNLGLFIILFVTIFFASGFIGKNVSACEGCSYPLIQKQTLSCPAGQSGSIVQKREKSTFPACEWGDWSTISNTCTADSFSLMINTSGTGIGTTTGAGIYSYGQVVTMTATASTSSSFIGWSGDPDCTDGSVTMNASKTCIATFDLIPVSAPTVTLTANPTTVAYNASSTLTWKSSNTTSCSASGDWSGTKTLSGNEVQNNLILDKSYTLACIGPGGTASSTAIVTVIAGPKNADLSISKTADKTTVNVGDRLTYTITLVNGGPEEATGVKATDILPVGLNFVSASSTLGSYATSTGVWTIGNMEDTSTTTLTLVTTVKDGTQGQTISNTTSVTATEADPTPTDNTSTVNVIVNNPVTIPTADLSISKISDKTTANVGDTVTYTVSLKNNGPDKATGVKVTDILSPELNFVSATSSIGSYATTTGEWNVDSLNNASSTTLTLVATIKSGSQGKTISNTATTTATQVDPTTANNVATVNVTINTPCTSNCGGGGSSADLSVTKTANKSTANVGDTINYTITLKNLGPDNATGVFVTDILPTGLNFVSATSTLGSYATSTGKWTIGNLNNASSTTLTITSTVKDSAQGQTISNTATKSADQTDPTTTNDSSSVNIVVNTPNTGCVTNCGGGGGGGGGGGPIYPNNLTISNEQVVETVTGVAMLTWNTNLPATRRVVYGNVSNPVIGSTPNYGYPSSSDLVSSPLLTAHGMVVSVDPNKTYYFREISTGLVNGITQTVVGRELVLNPGTGTIPSGTTSNSGSCYYLYDYLRKDLSNNPVEVKKLQVFLKTLEGFSNLQVTGVYDDATIAAVNVFQLRYAGDVLTPWGYNGSTGTGYVYILTKKKVNEIYCHMAFPVNTQQQSEIDAYRNFLLGLKEAGITTPTTAPSKTSTTTPTILLNNVVGMASSSTPTNTTLAGISTTTVGVTSQFTANILSGWNNVGNWLGLSCFANKGTNCSYRLINWILLIIILIILYLWYREWNQNRKIEDINKEIDISKDTDTNKDMME